MTRGEVRALRPGRWRRRLGRLVLVLAVLLLAGAVAFVTVAPFRAAVRTVALIPELLDLPVKPLSALTPEPQRVSASYGEPRPERIDIYLPSGADADRSRPAVLLALGVHPLPLDHPAVVRVARAIARLGMVVGVPESAQMRDSRVTEEEPGRLAEAFLVMADRPEVDSARAGMAGFSAGASLALVAAAEPRVVERVAYVNAFGGYGDAETLLVDTATRTTLEEGEIRPWQPDEVARRRLTEVLLFGIEPPQEQASLRAELEPVISADERPANAFDPAFAATLGDEARTVYEVVTAADRSDAEAAIAGAPESVRRHLAAISPVTVAGRIQASVFLMHDEGDQAIPVAHLDVLEGVLPEGAVHRATVFRLFEHVQPDAAGIGLDDTPELWKLFVHLQDLLDLAAS